MQEELLAASTPSDSNVFDMVSLMRILAGFGLLLSFSRMGQKVLQDTFFPDKKQIKKAVL